MVARGLLAATSWVSAWLAFLPLVGCASGPSVNEFRGPDGTVLRTVKCSSDPQKCMAMASSSCPGGGTYRVMSSESHAGGLVADVMPGPFTWYGMTYACGPSDGRLPDFRFQGQQYAPPPPVVVQPRPVPMPMPTTTNCRRVGDTVNCTTY